AGFGCLQTANGSASFDKSAKERLKKYCYVLRDTYYEICDTCHYLALSDLSSNAMSTALKSNHLVLAFID
uniref:hypothetical protein n=1 Tax=Rufibacter ruber TaxID=1783499 RepID=UPI000AE8B613